MTEQPHPLLQDVPDSTLALGPRLLEWLDRHGRPHPSLLDLDRERARRWGPTKRPTTPHTERKIP